MTATTNKYKKMRGFDGKTKSAKLFRRKQLDAMRREAEATNRTFDILGLILSGKSTYAYKDKRT